MGGVADLKTAIKAAVDSRIEQEARAKRGTIQDGMFHCGAKTYPFKQAVDCSLKNKVWAQLSTSGKAVIVGA